MGNKIVGTINYPTTGETQKYTDEDVFLKAVEDELPYMQSTGFSYMILTDNPNIHMKIDNLIYNEFGEKNPHENDLEYYERIVEKMSKISNVKVTPVEYENSKTVALASVTIDDVIGVNGIQVVLNKNNEPYVKLPQMKSEKTGEYVDIVYPTISALRLQLNDAVIKQFMFTQMANEPIKEEPVPVSNTEGNKLKIDVCSIQKTPSTAGNVRGLCSIVINDHIRINNIKVVQGKNGLFASLPSYQKRDGTYHSFVFPLDKKVFAEINNKVVAAYNTDFKYMKVSDYQLKELKNTALSYSEGKKDDKGKTTIRFDANIENEIKNVVNKNVGTKISKK